MKRFQTVQTWMYRRAFLYVSYDFLITGDSNYHYGLLCIVVKSQSVSSLTDFDIITLIKNHNTDDKMGYTIGWGCPRGFMIDKFWCYEHTVSLSLISIPFYQLWFQSTKIVTASMLSSRFHNRING